MDTIPRLETKCLHLRAIFPADARDVFAIYSDPKVAANYEFEPFEQLQQASELIGTLTNWFQNDIAVRWGMIEKATNQLIGTCCFDTFHPKYQSCNLGYNVRSEDWGKGYATEAVRSIVNFAFANGLNGPINRISAVTLPHNLGSERVLAKLGFAKEGLLREHGFWKNQYHDMNLFSLIKKK